MFRHLLILVSICLMKAVCTDPNYRLNTSIIPISYDIGITPYFDTKDEKAFTFDGEVTITFVTESITNQIKIHSEDLVFTPDNITVTSGAVSNIKLNATNPLIFDKNYTFAYINLQTELQVGIEYTLNIVYLGYIREDLSGFYRNYYIEGGVKKWLGATQMEPVHARKTFPCFDEPELKATFILSIDRPASYQPSLANTKLQSTTQLSNGYIREKFFPTPRMSTYLVAFLVSEFEALDYHVNGTKEFGVYTRPEAKNQSAYALDFGLRVVDALSGYFGIDYYSTDNNLKLDHIALPDFKAGAMENWGLVTYRESLLLYVPEESTPYYKYRVAQIVAHETTHMWFGNLVTCHWWSNTWLNEGFANYFQDYITALIEPDVGSADILITGSVYSAFDADASPDSVPISNNNVNSPAEISDHFGTITYQKAGSVIRMVHHLMGDAAFKFGLNAYLNANKFESGYPEKLYAGLHEGVTHNNSLAAYNGLTIDEIMSSWIVQAGHPILQVDIDYDNETVTLTQSRFYRKSSDKSDEIYKIPITYTTGVAPDFENTKPVFIMENKTQEISVKNISLNHDWVIFNVQETGLYRVNYDDHAWQIISSALKGSKREEIHYLNRAKIVNDLFAFFYADVVTFSRLHDVLQFLSEETNYSVWWAAINGFNRLRTTFLGTDILPNVEEYERQLLENIIGKLGYEVQTTEGTVALRHRMQILEFACKIEHQGCINHTVELFKNFKENGVEISPSLRPVAYCSGLRYGDEDDYEFLWQRMVTTNVANEARIIGDILGCTTNENKLKKYLVSMLEEDSPIRIQDLDVPLGSVVRNYENVDLVMDELDNNYELWSTIYPSMDSVLSTIASALHTEQDFEKFESWLAKCAQCSPSSLTSASSALETARASAVWAQEHSADIFSSLKGHSLLTLPSSPMLIIGLITVFYIQFLMCL